MFTRMAFAAIFIAGCNGDNGPPAPPVTQVAFTTVATGLTFPLFITQPPGDTGRLFILEQPGRIRIVKHGTLLATPYLDLSDSVSHGSEQGLLGMAFAPDFATSGAFYLHTTDTAGNILVLRYKAGSASADVALATSRTRILAIPHPFPNHNSGMLAFGADGYFYVGSCDGGGGGDPKHTG